MILNIQNECSQLKEVVVCWGYSVPDFKSFSTNDPEFTKYHKRPWDKNLLLKQQEHFFKKLSQYKVNLRFPKTDSELIWQMYTRDTGFVVNDTFFYSKSRGLKERAGEIDKLLELFKSLEITKIKQIQTGKIEGGDVLVNVDGIYVGNGSRSEDTAIEELLAFEKGRKLHLGNNVMHLDTRFTIIPNNYCLILLEVFNEIELKILSERFKFIPVLASETQNLGTNVLVVNPETIFSAKHNKRINGELKKVGFRVEEIDYTEPINLGGSFRCTTLPLVRE